MLAEPAVNHRLKLGLCKRGVTGEFAAGTPDEDVTLVFVPRDADDRRRDRRV